MRGEDDDEDVDVDQRKPLRRMWNFECGNRHIQSFTLSLMVSLIDVNIFIVVLTILHFLLYIDCFHYQVKFRYEPNQECGIRLYSTWMGQVKTNICICIWCIWKSFTNAIIAFKFTHPCTIPNTTFFVWFISEFSNSVPKIVPV
jgi:hypothetical protein